MFNVDTEAQRGDLLDLINGAVAAHVRDTSPRSVEAYNSLLSLAAAVQGATSTEATEAQAARLAESTAVIRDAVTAAVKADRAGRRKADRARKAKALTFSNGDGSAHGLPVPATPADAPAS